MSIYNRFRIRKMSALTASFLADCWAPLASDAAHLASRNAVATTDVLTVVQNRDVLQRRSHVYSNCVSKEGKCTTQIFWAVLDVRHVQRDAGRAHEEVQAAGRL